MGRSFVALWLLSSVVALHAKPAAAGGGVNIFTQSLSPVPLLTSLTILVAVTILFEVAYHHIHTRFHHDLIVSEVVKKMNR